MSKPSIQELITCLITLKQVLRDTKKTEKVLKLEIKNRLKELEQEKINELQLLEEKIFFMALRNKQLGRLSHIIKEEEVELREQAKKKINELDEELKERADFLKHEEAAAIAKIELELIKFGISKELINFFKKWIIS